MSRVRLELGDITTVRVDAIVNAASSNLLGGGGVDGAIHDAAGPRLLAACRDVKATLPGGLLETGGAVLTPAFDLPARYVIHCVGPMYDRHGENAWPLLASCYDRAIQIAREQQLDSIAFPSIGTGVYRCPVEKAAQVAIKTVRSATEGQTHPGRVVFVLFDERTYAAYERALT